MGELFFEDIKTSEEPPKNYKKDCLFCQYSAKKPRFLIRKNNHAFSIVYGMQERGLVLSKGQMLVISKEHRENFSELTKEEWKAHLPLIKDAIIKIGTAYQPVGFDVFSSLNKEGGQTHFHSHIHIIPKYKKDYGYCRRKWDLSLTSQDYKEIEKKLQTKQGVIKENDKAVAELVPFGKQAGKSHIIIKPKKPIPNYIEKLDEETWAEMWELMKASVKKCKENLGAKGFWWHIPLGEMTDVDQTTRSEFQIDIMPRWHVPTYEERHGGETRSVPENERIAEKLINMRSKRKTSTSFYELIKKTYQEKGRPLKIIADWDDLLQATKPTVIYDGTPGLNVSFKEFFEEFWEKSVISVSSAEGSIIEEFTGSQIIKEAIDNWMRKKKEGRKDPKNYNFRIKDYNFYERSPLLSTSEELLQCLKEDLISELIIISAYRKGENTEFINDSARLVVEEKTGKIKKSFGQFPCVKIEMTGQKKDHNSGKHRPRRSETIRDKYSDFDIYIDDSQTEIKRTREIFPNKIYVLPDYLCTRGTQGENIYHVKTTVSDLTDEDFVKAAEEYKQKQVSKLTSRAFFAPSSEREYLKTTYFYWGLGSGIIITLLGLGIYWLFSKKTKAKSK